MLHSSAASLIISSFLTLRNGLPVMPVAMHSINADLPEPLEPWLSLSRLCPNTNVVTPWSST
ncbi:hypothetical protein [Bacteroides sp.]|uniref:hypothetical protein n=1 Tax=Bacteroides sp. TaxID=29523 RepID=UPI0025893981|nr:hypothetical protein [Bacteroides sp.]